MKRRETKNRIRKVRRLLAKEVRTYLTVCSIDNSHNSDATVTSICIALSSLLEDHLALGSRWPHNERWLDGISSPEIAVHATGNVYVRGQMWWGLRKKVGGDQRSESFLATICLDPSGTLSYRLTFADQYCFSSRSKASNRCTRTAGAGLVTNLMRRRVL